VDDPEAVAKRIVEQGLNVRDVEKLGQVETKATTGKAPRAKAEKDPDTRALEKALEDVLGLNVSIEHGPKGGELRLKYSTLDQLDDLCRRLRT
jgi:ParB family chromosome partitioning protein